MFRDDSRDYLRRLNRRHLADSEKARKWTPILRGPVAAALVLAVVLGAWHHVGWVVFVAFALLALAASSAGDLESRARRAQDENAKVVKEMSRRDDRAYYEAARAVVARNLGVTVQSVSVDDDGNLASRTVFDREAVDPEAALKISLASQVYVELLRSSRPAVDCRSEDDRQALEIALVLSKQDRAVALLLVDRCRADLRQLLIDNAIWRRQIDRVGRALSKEHSLDGDQLAAIWAAERAWRNRTDSDT
jgi:hypothetical protein